MTGILLATPMIASAQTVTSTPRGALKTANQAARLTTLHTQADTAIASRLTALNSALTRITSLVKLSAAQKTTYTGQINADITALTTLKSKADADIDVATLQADYKSIFTSYRVYAEFLPQLHLLVASDTMDVTADKLSDLAIKLQTRIQSAGSPSTLTSLLSDMQAKIADAKTQYGNVQTQITALTPQSYDSNPSGTAAALKTARTEIQTGSSDLKTAWADAKQILQALKVSTTITPSSTQ